MTNPVSGVGSTGATSTTPTGTTKTAGDEFGKDTFLKLLVAQLKYQNPLQPADGQQYMAQMAQFTTVEKLADIQKSQSDAVTWQRAVAGQGMIGQQITATVAATGTKVSGLVTGMSFSDSGARLTLSDGTTVSVEEVTAVKAASAAASTPASTPAPAAVPAPTPAATPAPTPAATPAPATTPTT
ncbi:MAG: flagellar basal-body rod modification protein FlgD, partial [Frankiaceae bacterium]|nr:flagellar basal-body rod modification protein FlgD [Frankiaceae bacterium]